MLKLLAAGLAILGAAELLRGFAALFDPISLDYSEMIVAGMAQQLAHTGSLAAIYAPTTTPYGLPGVQYPPLFIWLNALILNFSSLSPLLAARLLAWVAYAGAGLLVGMLVWQETHQQWAAVTAAFVPFCFWSVLIFVNAARPDPLALVFSLLAAFFYRRNFKQVGQINRSTIIKLGGVALLCALAFFSKQTYLAIGAAICCDLLGQRGRRSYALIFMAILSSLLGVGLVLLNVASAGTLVGIFEPARAARFIFDKVPGFVGFFVLDHTPLLLLAGVGLVWQWQRGDRFWTLYTVWAALACTSIVKDGAVDYYFNELAYILSVQVGILVGSQLGPKAVNIIGINKKLITVAVGVQVLIASGMFLAWGQARDFDNFRPAYNQALATVEQAQNQKRAVLVFADNLLLASNHNDKIGDYFIYSILVENGRHNAQPLLHDLESGYYDFIISEDFFRWPSIAQTALNEHYQLHYLDGLDGRHLFRVYTRS